MHAWIRRRSARGQLIAAVAVVMSLVGCSGATPGPSSSATPRPSSDASSPASSPSSMIASPGPSTPVASATASTDPGAEFSGDKQQDDGFPSLDSEVLPTEVRAGAQDGYTQIVIYFDGAGAPHYSAEYGDAPTAAGSGKPITMRGNAFLRLTLSGIRTPGESEQLAPRLTKGINNVAEVFVGPPFEGMAQIVLGVDSELPFRVFTMKSPTRVVIDVQEG